MASLSEINAWCRIPRVPDLLRKNEKHAKMFDPAVVPIGPYHRGKSHLSEMEGHKKEAATAFAGANTNALCNKVSEVADTCRDCYDRSLLLLMSKDEFTRMLFIDGCFILQFIDRFVRNDMKDFPVSAHLHGFILRDMFLLENQLPYLLLEKLMEVKRVDIDTFLDSVPGTPKRKTQTENRGKSIEGPHRHILARLQELQLGPRGETSQLPWKRSWLSFRSARELVRAGIAIKPGETNFLREVKFEPGPVWGRLSLPPIVIDDLTRPRLLNMIAFEMCSGSTDGGYGVMSFVWFLNLLIDHADDVKELREAGVLVNMLGSDEEVAEFFNETVADLLPDQQPYYPVINNINDYRNNKFRVPLYRMLHRRFGSPWAAIAFLVAFVLLVLTVVQTVYTAIQTHYTIHPPTK
ncbi:UPF0481 protein At3g47200-like [Ananas comosus]|uniref:UPF0481 protein At3g47200-like n=1 Tax=Ananas comosus TaxID=4615 RepID=A0A6P5EXN1_ANACO|nr:UPF0481 protein At3g47200-like [Ananas comosus]